MKFLRRTHGTQRQIGKPFPVTGKKRLPKVAFPIKYKKPQVSNRHAVKRFFGSSVREAYQRLRDNTIPKSSLSLLFDDNTVLSGELPENKQYWRSIVRKAVKAEKPLAYAITTDVYFAPAEDKVAPISHPFRKESVFVTVFSPRWQRSAAIDYERVTPKIIDVKKPEVWKRFTDNLVGNVYR